MNKDSQLQMILQEINNIPGPKKIMSDKAMVCCPYHADKNPSMSIQLDPQERNAPIGFCYCFGCKKSVGWNTLATTLNLKRLGKVKNLTSDNFSEPEAFAESFFATEPTHGKKKFEELEVLEFEDEFPFDEWRDVKVSLLEKVGAKFAKHKDYGIYYVWIPVNVNGKLRGYVKAKLQKAKPGKSSYLNAKGSWSRKWGLLYFDYSLKLMRKKGLKTMVLCEGPRDSLRFIEQGIPAMSVIGAMNWGSDKRSLLEESGIERLILAFDGDKAGHKACSMIYKDARQFFDVKYLALWKHEPGSDPFTCKQLFIDAVAEEL